MKRLDRTNAVHHVYRCYDADDRLIYVGCSAALFKRLEQHRRTSWWAPQVERVAAKVYPTGIEAREAERKAIRLESPRWNMAGRSPLRSRDQWDDWLLMLLNRKSFSGEIRRFADLYVKTWAKQPPADLLARLEAAEAETAANRVRFAAEHEAAMRRNAEIRLEDELALRRERKARKAKAKKRARKAARRAEVAR